MQALFNKSHGFTLPELLISVTVGAVMVGVIIFGLGNYYQDSVNSTQRTAQDTDTRSVLRSIENEIVNSNGFITDLVVTASPLGSSNTIAPWSYKGNNIALPNNRVLIAQTYATDLPATDPDRMLVFNNLIDCSDPTTSTPTKNAAVYFIAKPSSSSTYNLYRRTIVNTAGTPMCSIPNQKQTCAPGTFTSPNTTCQAVDAMLMSNIDNFTVDYYASSNDKDPIANQYTTALPSDISAAKSVKLTVTTNRYIEGVLTPNTASIRISRPY